MSDGFTSGGWLDLPTPEEPPPEEQEDRYQRIPTELARAMCLSSWHGLSRTVWPCPYHAQRARDTLDVMAGKMVTRRTREEAEK